MNRRRFLACLGGTTGGVMAAQSFSAARMPGEAMSTDVFVSGTEGINTYRIPALLRSANGDLMVFCEARKESIADASPTALVLRRSLDNGRTWLPMQTLLSGEGSEAIMNPCPVVDGSTGTIVLFCIDAHKIAQGHHRHLILTSTGHGAAWSEPHRRVPTDRQLRRHLRIRSRCQHPVSERPIGHPRLHGCVRPGNAHRLPVPCLVQR